MKSSPNTSRYELLVSRTTIAKLKAKRLNTGRTKCFTEPLPETGNTPKLTAKIQINIVDSRNKGIACPIKAAERIVVSSGVPRRVAAHMPMGIPSTAAKNRAGTPNCRLLTKCGTIRSRGGCLCLNDRISPLESSVRKRRYLTYNGWSKPIRTRNASTSSALASIGANKAAGSPLALIAMNTSIEIATMTTIDCSDLLTIYLLICLSNA